ncbi:MAG: succinate dehydrogenase, cytochrome b556 subunit [Actinomycetota bacterium]
MDTRTGRSPYRRIFYRGGEGMWSWILHRGSGLAVLGFLYLHILDTSLVGFGEEHYNRFVSVYKQAFIRPLEVILVAAVLYHAFNGIRVILIDFWAKGARYQRQLAQAQIALTVALFVPAAVMMLRPIF